MPLFFLELEFKYPQPNDKTCHKLLDTLLLETLVFVD